MGRGSAEQHGRSVHPRPAQEARARFDQEHTRRRIHPTETVMMSIRRHLLIWLICAFCIAIGVTAFGVYRQARIEAREIFDYQLQQMATLFPTQGFGPISRSLNVDPDIENVVVVQIWNEGGTQVYQSQPMVPPP